MGLRLVNMAIGLIAVTYPLLALFLIRVMSPYWIVALLVVALLVRLFTGWRSTPISMIYASAVAIIVMSLTSMINSDLALRLYPVFMTGAMLMVFTISLIRPPSMIERFARIMEPDLGPEGVAYTRRVTEVWCGFFAVNILISLWTVFYASFETWALYNGLISYLLMGLLFGGEFLVRRWVKRAKTP